MIKLTPGKCRCRSLLDWISPPPLPVRSILLSISLYLSLSLALSFLSLSLFLSSIFGANVLVVEKMGNASFFCFFFASHEQRACPTSLFFLSFCLSLSLSLSTALNKNEKKINFVFRKFVFFFLCFCFFEGTAK